MWESRGHERGLTYHCDQHLLSADAPSQVGADPYSSLAQTAFARWHDVLATPPPPPTARGNCPASWAADYAQAVWHYVRVLGLAATAAGRANVKTRAEVAAELDSLKVPTGTRLRTLSTVSARPCRFTSERP